jgi:hypothetical protein
MAHPIYRVRSFEIVSAYTLRVGFDDGTEQTVDLQPILTGELFGPLRDAKLINQVRIDTKSECWCGLMARTSIRPHCMTGRSMNGPFENLPEDGSRPMQSDQIAHVFNLT